MRHLDVILVFFIAIPILFPVGAVAQDTLWGPLSEQSRIDIASDADLTSLGLTGRNKPNGKIFRFRESIPTDLPEFIPTELDGQTLVIADKVDAGYFCLYKGPYTMDATNNRFTAMLVSDLNDVHWLVNLNSALSATQHLEIQDVRYSNGLLYFNEACQSYSRDADGACSSLVCLDPSTMTVLWRTPPLTSNNIILIYRGVVICGYGFTDEPDYLHLVDAVSGAVLSTTELDSAHDYLEIKGDSLWVATYGSLYQFLLPVDLR